MSPQEKQELVNYRIIKSRQTFKEVDILIPNELWNTAVNRLYYSCFYAVVALLAEHDIDTQSHSGARQREITMTLLNSTREKCWSCWSPRIN
jgi:uncharacterized protein (UPF0332 family)